MPAVFGDFLKEPPKCNHIFGEWQVKSSENRLSIKIDNTTHKIVHSTFHFRVCPACGYGEFEFEEVR